MLQVIQNLRNFKQLLKLYFLLLLFVHCRSVGLGGRGGWAHLGPTQDQSAKPPPFGKLCQRQCRSRREGRDSPISSKCFSLKAIHHTLISLARARHVAAPNTFREVEKCTFPMSLEEKGVFATHTLGYLGGLNGIMKCLDGSLVL